MSHMFADSISELHFAAGLIGIENHFQDKPGRPHYDICQSNKKKLLNTELNGKTIATEMCDKKIVRKLFHKAK